MNLKPDVSQLDQVRQRLNDCAWTNDHLVDLYEDLQCAAEERGAIKEEAHL